MLSSVAESDSSMKEPYNQRVKKPMKKLKLHEEEKNELGVVRHSEANQLREIEPRWEESDRSAQETEKVQK